MRIRTSMGSEREGTERTGEARLLETLVAELDGAAVDPGAEQPPSIAGITDGSEDVVEGALFIAIRGTEVDGHAFIGEAVERGAAAVVADREYTGKPGVPVVRVPDTRRASAELASAWYGHPARRLRLVGITGSIGKTSVLAMLEAMLLQARRRVGTVGSLGVNVAGETRTETGHTVPGPLLLHRELARIADEGCELAAMEVTSHALVQERVHGLRFDLGVFTNLVPLEHSEYHDSLRDYTNAKRRFFDHLRPCVPLIYNVDDKVVRRLVRESHAEPVGCGTGRAALVKVQPGRMDADGIRFTLDVRRPLPTVHAGERPAGSWGFHLRLLGHSNMMNASLAAAAALCLDVDPATIEAALAALEPQPRRLQVVRREPFLVLDDTVGHPDSISAVFQVVQAFDPGRVHIAFAVRGQRGPEVNRHAGEALATWAAQVPLGRLAVTRSEGAADERNRVDPEELEAVEDALRRHGTPHTLHDRLDEAVLEVLEAAGPGDLVLLLGAQGMDEGQRVAEDWLRSEPGRRH